MTSSPRATQCGSHPFDAKREDDETREHCADLVLAKTREGLADGSVLITCGLVSDSSAAQVSRYPVCSGCTMDIRSGEGWG
ncbi:hypothetical protein BofuT4_uP042450.1 [Botrytis cinerea T4]|uniref:Uncharacterized protein n=1 Tax=Botryotinia fuckeliana (strain T4) TaxID=999810 RepID=G2Y1U4_BOTF4|nr:hypothetical protein BofuT4_uP042450.1 [Botrytis cinerea T4]